MGYIVFLGGPEMLMYIATALAWLILIALSTEPNTAPLAGFLRTAETVAWDQLLAIPFVLGALMFYVLLYKSRLVPRWLSVWGLVGAVLYIVLPLGSMFELSLGFLMAPLALQEMVMAVWLITRGFDQSLSSAEPDRQAPMPRVDAIEASASA
jgi:hypothetical protein